MSTISDRLNDVNITSIFLLEVEQKNAGTVGEAHFWLELKPPGHLLYVVLMPFFVALDGFYTLYWSSDVDFEQVLIQGHILVSGFVLYKNLYNFVL